MNVLKTAAVTVRHGGMRNRVRRARHTAALVLALVGLLSAALMNGPIQRSSAETVAGGWSYTGSLSAPRFFHTATLLPEGKVLVAGGTGFSGGRVYGLDIAELYDAVKGKWSATGGLNVPRTVHTATLLKDGKVLIVGGVDGESLARTLNSAELYDPKSERWSVTGSLNMRRCSHTATLLKNGKVLVVGGGEIIGWDETMPLDTVELYDPDTGLWSLTGNLHTAVEYHTATLLQNGKVLVLGSTEGSPELYDPDTGTWSRVVRLGRSIGFGHTATLLENGKVLVAGGQGPGFFANSAALFDPATGEWGSTSHLKRERFDHTATLLPDGKVLVVGGVGFTGSGGTTSQVSLDSSELYDPDTETWSLASSLSTPRNHHTATLLPDGKALVAGGLDGFSIGGTHSAELMNDFAVVAPPKITMASVAGKKLFVVGEKFETGAVILINGEKQKTRNDDQNPQTTLIGKKAGKKIKAGDRLQVRNSDGALSEEFTFTGL